MIRTPISLGTLAGILALTNGCSVVGLGIGSRIHSDSTRRIDATHWEEVLDVEPNTRLDVTTRSNERIHGLFRGMLASGGTDYGEAYEASQNADEGARGTPEPGQWIKISRKAGLFDGDPGHYFLGLDGNSVLVKHPRAERPGRIGFAEIEFLEKDGHRIPIETVVNLLSEDRLPIVSGFAIRTGDRTDHVPLEDLDEIRIVKRGSHKVAGFAIGLIVDVALLAAWINAWSDF